MSETIENLVRVLKQGGVVACPTETFVGLLADALNPHAIEKVQNLKGRQKDVPIGVLLPDISFVESIALPLSPEVRKIAECYWPGPLTLVVKAKKISTALTKDGKVGIRVPGKSPAFDLVRAFGGPLTATSANKSGATPCMDTRFLHNQLFGEVEGVFSGTCYGKLPSTVVDVSENPYRIIREGEIKISPLFF